MLIGINQYTIAPLSPQQKKRKPRRALVDELQNYKTCVVSGGKRSETPRRFYENMAKHSSSPRWQAGPTLGRAFCPA